MLQKQYFKNAHIVVFLFALLCIAITSHTLLKSEFERIDLDRQIVTNQLEETVSSSLKSYELELSELISLFSANKIDSEDDFELIARQLTEVNQPAIENLFFAKHIEKMVSNSNSVAKRESLPIIYSYPNKAILQKDLLVSKVFYSDNLLDMLQSKRTVISAPFDPQISSHNIGDFVLSEAIHFSLPHNLSFSSDYILGVVGLSFKVSDLLLILNLSHFKNIDFRIADITGLDIQDRLPSNSFFYQQTKDPVDWDNEDVSEASFAIGGRKWLIEAKFNTSDWSLVNWNRIIAPALFLFILGLLISFYLRKVNLSYSKKLSEKSKQVEIDPLTGLHSRYSVYDKLTKTITKAEANQTQVAVICMDLDHFKTINDAFNHRVGDKMLAKVAQRLQSLFPSETTIGRLGGDEFLVFLELSESLNVNHVKSLCDEVIAQVGQSYFIEGRMLTVGCSLGVALYPDYGDDAITLVKNADMGMYKAKSMGRATYHFYDGSIGKQLARNAQVENRLRQAMHRNELQIYFQPKVNLQTLECVGLEALLRWEDEELGTVSPSEFIPIAEQSGIILPLGEWVIDQTCYQISQWRKSGLAVPPVAINCSAAQFRRHDFLTRLLRSLNNFDVLPPQIELEVTESILIEDPENCSKLLRQVSNLGMKITIDDFGTGYSSLSYLRDLPFECIKIDQAFICNVMEDENHAALTNAIIKMGQSLKLQVVAEGITTHEQLAYLRSLGCDIGQGFLFGEAFQADQLSHNAEKIEQSLSKQQNTTNVDQS